MWSPLPRTSSPPSQTPEHTSLLPLARAPSFRVLWATQAHGSVDHVARVLRVTPSLPPHCCPPGARPLVQSFLPLFTPGTHRKLFEWHSGKRMRWCWEATNPVSPAALASHRSAKVRGEPLPGTPLPLRGTAAHLSTPSRKLRSHWSLGFRSLWPYLPGTAREVCPYTRRPHQPVSAPPPPEQQEKSQIPQPSEIPSPGGESWESKIRTPVFELRSSICGVRDRAVNQPRRASVSSPAKYCLPHGRVVKIERANECNALHYV